MSATLFSTLFDRKKLELSKTQYDNVLSYLKTLDIAKHVHIPRFLPYVEKWTKTENALLSYKSKNNTRRNLQISYAFMINSSGELIMNLIYNCQNTHSTDNYKAAIYFDNIGRTKKISEGFKLEN